MATRVDLPDGAWADLSDPKNVSERKRRPCKAAFARLSTYLDRETGKLTVEPSDPAFADALEAADEVNDLVCVALVEAWSFEAPVTLEALQNLPGSAYDKIRNAVVPLALQLFPDYTVNTVTEDGREGRPLAPTGA